MKKFINILLCLTIIISSCSMITFADETAEVTTEYTAEYSAEANLVSYLGIMNTSNSQEFWARNVTRAEFAQYVYNIVKSFDILDKDSYYVDVARGSDLEIALNYLVKTGVLTVGDTRLFRPDDFITYNEAYKMLIVIAGYEPYALANGGYPIGYLDAARYSDISEGITHSDYVDNASAAKLFYNTLLANMYDVDSVTIIGTNYTDQYTDTVLERYFDVYRVDGVVTQKNRVDLNSSTRINPGLIEINGEIYDDLIEDQDLLGYKVRAFVKDNEHGIDSVIYAEISDKNDIIEIDAEDLVDVSIDSIKYYNENDKIKTIKLKDAAFVKNGSLLGSKIPEKAHIDNGKIVVISTDEGFTYETVIITEYEIFIVGLVDGTYKRVFDKYQPKKVLELDEDKLESVEIILSNSKANFFHIEEGDVISVIRSEDKELVTAIISNDKVTGTIESINKNKSEYITVNGVEYRLTDDLSKRRTASIGDTVELIFDITGKVAEIASAEPVDFKVGYAHKMGVTGSGLSQGYGIEVYTLDGVNAAYEFEDKVYLNDGRKKVDYETVIPMLQTVGTAGEMVFEPQLIRFGLNSKGKIYAIVIKDSGEDERDSRYFKKILDEGGYTFYRTLIVPKTPINTDTIILQVPNDVAMQNIPDYVKHFKVKTPSEMSTSRSYKLSAYKTSNETPYADVVIYKVDAWDELDAYDKYAMVRKTYTALDANDSLVYRLELFEKGKGVQYITNDTCAWPEEDLVEGDIIQFGVDNTGCVHAIKLIYRPSDPGLKTIAAMQNSDYAKQGRITGHYTIEKYEGEEMDTGGANSLLSLSDDLVDTDIEFCLYYSRLNPVAVYDSTKRPGDRVYLGTIDNVISYNGSGGIASSYIIAHANVGTMQSMFIIN